MPCASRRDAVSAAVEVYNRTHPAAPLPRPAARLLAVMFATGDVCSLSQQALVAEGFGKTLPAVLRALVEAGLVSRQAGTSRVGIVTLNSRVQHGAEGSPGHRSCFALSACLLAPDFKSVRPDRAMGMGYKVMSTWVEVAVDE